MQMDIAKFLAESESISQKFCVTVLVLVDQSWIAVSLQRSKEIGVRTFQISVKVSGVPAQSRRIRISISSSNTDRYLEGVGEI